VHELLDLAAATDPSTEDRAAVTDRVVRRMGLAGFGLASGLAAVAWWSDAGRWATLAVAGVAAVLWVLTNVRRAHTTAGVFAYVTLAVYVAALAGASLALGGFAAGVTPWLASAPLLVAIYGERRIGWFALAVVGVSLASVGAAVLAFDVGPYGRAPDRVLLQGLAVFAATVFLFGVSGYLDRLRLGEVRRAYDLNHRMRVVLDDQRRTHRALEQANARVADAARAAGMAEVATGVLHNLGNALTSVYVSARVVNERLDPTVAERIERAADLALARPDDVARYLRALAAKVRSDTEANRAELATLEERLEHVNTVIQAQQSHARSVGLVSDVHVETLLRQAVALTRRGEERPVHVELDVPPTLSVQAESHKLLQILANLLTNARDAILATGRAGRLRVIVRPEPDWVTFDIVDQGIGIAAEVLPRLFQHGFTTKANGNGFGLHVSALAAADLGGTLSAGSEGLGRGATFTLRIPMCATAPHRQEATPRASATA
jgi:signal transduction histidine kinase